MLCSGATATATAKDRGCDVRRFIAALNHREPLTRNDDGDFVLLKDAVDLRSCLNMLMEEYDDRKSQFGDYPLWVKHEDTKLIEWCKKVLLNSYTRE